MTAPVIAWQEAAQLAAWAEDAVPRDELLDWLMSFAVPDRLRLIALLRYRALAALPVGETTRH